jgi:hypothetical protein
MNTSERQYVPKVGELVKLREWLDYTSRGLSPWAYLRVKEVHSDYVLANHAPRPLVREEDQTEEYKLTYTSINPPLGWQARYTIYCEPDKAQTVVSNWFQRGIVVRANHCIGDSEGSTFQPLDNSAQPTWKHSQVTDTILAEDCPKLFRVVAATEEELNHYSNPTHPNLRAMGRSVRAQTIKAMRAEGWEVSYVPYAGGFWTRRKETIVHDWAE